MMKKVFSLIKKCGRYHQEYLIFFNIKFDHIIKCLRWKNINCTEAVANIKLIQLFVLAFLSLP